MADDRAVLRVLLNCAGRGLSLQFIIIINEQIDVAFSPKTTRTRNIQKTKKKRKTTCSVDRDKQAVEQRSEPSVRHCKEVRL